MSQNIGTLVSAAIRPNDSLDQIASAYGNEIKGGSHGYETFDEMITITLARRQWGMLVTIYNDGDSTNNATYQLRYGHYSIDLLDNSNWVKTSLDNNITTEWVDSVITILGTEPTLPNSGDRYLLGTSPMLFPFGINWDSLSPTIIVEYDPNNINYWNITYPTNGMTVRVDNDNNSMYKYEGDFPTGEWKQEKITQVFYIEPTTTNGSTYSVSTTPVFNTYSKDLIFLTKFNTANIGISTLNINGLGDKYIKIATEDGIRDLIVTDILVNGIYTLTYNGTYFQMTKPFPSDTYNIEYYIAPGEVVTVQEYEQYWVYGDLTIEGSIVNYGKVVVANGAVNLVNGGSLNNLMAGELILVDLFNTPIFNTTDTIQLSSVMTINGPSVSAIVLNNSLTTDHINSINTATASWVLSNDGTGLFQWIEAIAGTSSPGSSASGSSGTSGSSGSSGTSGSSGSSGTSGSSGSSGTSGVQGNQGIEGPVGVSGLIWQGTWSNNSLYNMNDAVGYASASWWCVATVSSTASVVAPDLDTLHDNWTLLAAQGSQGQMGTQGVQGDSGSSGSSGTSGTSGTDGAGLSAKSGIVLSSDSGWVGNSYDVVFIQPFGSTNYSIAVDVTNNSQDVTITNKTASGFRVTTQMFAETFDWIAIANGEIGVAGTSGSSGSSGTSGSSGSSGTSGAKGATGSPGATGSTIAWLEFNATNLTVWNNGKGNIVSNTSFGDGALASNTIGTNNTAVGGYSLSNNINGQQNTAFGYLSQTFNTAGNNNSSLGLGSLSDNSVGISNTAMGRGAVKSNTSGSNNTGYGDNALGNITTGNNNSAFGFQAGFYAGSLASSNVYLGYNSGPSFTTPENNKLYIANAAGTPLIGGDFSTKTVTIDQVLVLTPTTSAPSSPVNGMIAVYGVGAAQHIYCYINGAWKQLDN